MKYCKRCEEDKPRDDFYRAIKNSDGLGSYCKECCSEETAEINRKSRIEGRIGAKTNINYSILNVKWGR